MGEVGLANALGFVAMPISMCSLLLIARGRRIGWAIGLVADLLWLAACVASGVYSFMVNEIVFLCIRVYGWRRSAE